MSKSIGLEGKWVDLPVTLVVVDCGVIAKYADVSAPLNRLR